MSPLSRGVVAMAAILVATWATSETANVPPYEVSVAGRPENLPKSINDIEAFVKKLEYEAVTGGANSVDGVDVVEFNLLPDLVADDVQAGVQEEFLVVDQELGDNSTEPQSSRSDPSRSRQLSLIYQGVYAPDARFNAFADGVMVNMVAEMKRKRMDPLYFRVYDRGIVEHVSTQATRSGRRDEPSVEASSFMNPQPHSGSNPTGQDSTREGRQSGNAIGGGVIRGLTSVKRFGNAEVQVAGNTTLVRGHWLVGPLDMIVDYRGSPGITRVRTGLQAVQFDTLTSINRYGAEMSEYQLISPLFDYMPYYGNRTLAQQRTTELVVRHLFSNASFMSLLMRDAFEIASYDKIIPQFGTEANYYSVLQYLFAGGAGAGAGGGARARGVSIPGVPSQVAAYLGGVAKQARTALENLG